MKIHTRQSKANEALARWRGQYAREREDVAIKLEHLGKNPNPDDVDAAIGNDSWTRVGECNECKKESTLLVELGEEPDYESSTAWICVDCLVAAVVAAQKELDKGKA